MRFRYPLQKLVDLKKNEKEQAEWMLSEALSRCRHEERLLTDLESERQSVNSEIEHAASKSTTISQIQMLQGYLQHLDQRIRLKMEDLISARSDVAYKQQTLTSKVMEEKVWAKAKEKAQRQFVSIVQKKEQDELDEIALTRRAQMI